MNERTVAQPEKAVMPPFTSVSGGILQRKCACGQHTIAGWECDECRKKRVGPALPGAQLLQRHSATQAEPTAVPPIVYDVLRSPGQPLDASTRAFFEPRFGHDFSQVRVHADAKAAESARAVNAVAYTVGSDIVFGPGQHAPGSPFARWLLAHELAHTVQQAHRSDGALREADRSTVSQAEQQADAVASSVLSGGAPAIQALRAVPTQIQRVDVEDCNANTLEVTKAYQDASDGLERVAGMVHSSIGSPGVQVALATYFGKLGSKLPEAIATRLLIIRSNLQRATIECENPGSTLQSWFCPTDTLAYVRAVPAFFGLGNIHLCEPAFHNLAEPQRAATLVHESAHRCCSPGEAYYTLNCAETAETKALSDMGRYFNADSYACLVQTLA